jgi:hypothetical protein
MEDPIDNFNLPDELKAVLSPADQKKVMATILEIDLGLLKNDPQLEEGRVRGGHLWLLFDAIAAPLQNVPDFRERLVPDFIPRVVEAIRHTLSWYPHNQGDLRPFYLAPPMRKWRNIHRGQENFAPGSSIPEHPHSSGAANLDERKSAYDAYKRICKDAGVKMTEKHLARLANPAWNTRDPVMKWKAGKDRPGDDGRIRRALQKVPSAGKS